jgi:hypothetical protein
MLISDSDICVLLPPQYLILNFGKIRTVLVSCIFELNKADSIRSAHA